MGPRHRTPVVQGSANTQSACPVASPAGTVLFDSYSKRHLSNLVCFDNGDLAATTTAAVPLSPAYNSSVTTQLASAPRPSEGAESRALSIWSSP